MEVTRRGRAPALDDKVVVSWSGADDVVWSRAAHGGSSRHGCRMEGDA
jgi:hypothetical protein